MHSIAWGMQKKLCNTWEGIIDFYRWFNKNTESGLLGHFEGNF